MPLPLPADLARRRHFQRTLQRVYLRLNVGIALTQYPRPALESVELDRKAAAIIVDVERTRLQVAVRAAAIARVELALLYSRPTP